MAGLALDRDVAAHHLAEASADREPEAGAAVFARREEEAWENSWNNLPICSGVMPMPVSATARVIQSRPFSCPWRASIVMVPRSVNLLALLMRLSRACRSRIWSACIVPIAASQ